MNNINLSEEIAKCFGDTQVYDGGWFAEYDVIERGRVVE